MILIIPLGGEGTRFRNQGYTKPKALIPVFGKPILFWLLETIKQTSQNIQHIFIPHTKEYEDVHLQAIIDHNFPSLSVQCITLSKQTRGALETITLCLSTLKIPDSPIMCLDSDNFYTCDILKRWSGKNLVVSFQDKQQEPIYSYVTTERNTVVAIVEKKKLSDRGCRGAEAFR